MEYFFKSLMNIKGVGEKFFTNLERLLPNTKYKDILFYLPIGVIDRSSVSSVIKAEIGKIATLKINVLKHFPAPYVKGKKLPYKVLCSDDSGFLTLIFFNTGSYLQRQLPVGKEVCVSGKIEEFDGGRVMLHPDYIVPVENFSKVAGLEPLYSLTYGITNKMIRHLISIVLSGMPKVEEWQVEPEISFNDALKILHNPVKDENIMIKAKKRLAYDEILANQLSLTLSREQFKQEKGAKLISNNTLVNAVLNNLGFNLTNAQLRVWNEIKNDLMSDYRMLRLLQGDVGSGKTIIAILSLLVAVENNKQGALMAPTEILAEQHFETLTKLLKKSKIDDKVKILLLTGKDKGSQKQKKLSLIRDGDVDIVIGTHALFQENVEFKSLGLAVIDEQHKFGVYQRLALSDKGKNDKANILTMTATPIPRTLAMTSFGDMDLSEIDEMPPNRKDVQTTILNMSKIPELMEMIKKKLENGEIKKLYWVCPLIEESKKLDLSDVVSRFQNLKECFGNIVNMVHGKIKPEEKDKIMKDFADKAGKTKILLATTVIEVGVNVPEATLMVIEHSERFGLSSLHQLRGRIGRGAEKSFCILLHSNKITKIAKERLSVMKETTDGFKIAEKDLKLRGAGDVLGVRQSGMIDFRIADLDEDYKLFLTATQDAKNIIKYDFKNNTERWKKIKKLLQLFEYTKKLELMNN